MDVGETRTITQLLTALYGERFPVLTDGMLRLWQQALATADMDTVRAGIRRWASHHTHYPPSLDELLEQIEWIQEAELKHLARRDGTRGQEDGNGLLGTFAQAEDAFVRRNQSPEDITYGRLMGQLARTSLTRHPRMTPEELAAQCRTWSNDYPELAHHLAAAAYQFAAQQGSTAVPLMLAASEYDDAIPF